MIDTVPVVAPLNLTHNSKSIIYSSEIHSVSQRARASEHFEAALQSLLSLFAYLTGSMVPVTAFNTSERSEIIDRY